MDARTKVEPVTLVTLSSADIGHSEDMPRLRPPVEPGDLGSFGGYRVLGLVGCGGMGAVYRAIDPALGRVVALKVMLPSLSASATGRRRFLREARAVAAVRHDHVVTIFQVGEDGGLPFLAMEYLSGASLSDRCNEGPVPLADAVRIGREVAQGLSAAHAAGVVHRDVKPENIWLEAPAGRVKLIDFGLALTSDDGGPPISRRGASLGTPAYMSPEQAAGKPADHRSDLFCLGVVLYRLVTGRLPFPGATAGEVAAALAAGNPTPVPSITPDAPAELAALIHRLLATDPAARPESAERVAAELAEVETRMLVGGVHPVPAPEEVPLVWSQLHEALPADSAARRHLTRRQQWRLLAWAVALLIATWITFVQLRPKDEAPDAKPRPVPVKTASK